VKAMLVALFLVMTLATAQKHTNLDDAVQLLQTANREIIVVAPVLRIKAVAEGLRSAGVDRGVRLLGITEKGAACDRASYWEALRLGAKLELRTITKVKGYALLIDGNRVLVGDALGRFIAPGEANSITVLEGVAAQQQMRDARIAWTRGVATNCF
jgi:hypothetical protein